MKAVRSKCCKYLKKLTSISKNTSIAEIEGGSRILRFVIDDYRQLIVDKKCLRQRPQDGYIFITYCTVFYKKKKNHFYDFFLRFPEMIILRPRYLVYLPYLLLRN